MSAYTYYCEIKDKGCEYPPGVYKVIVDQGVDPRWFSNLNRLSNLSDRIWKQGPKGGVRIVKAPWRYGWPMGYVTNNEKYMREFAWIKLQAKAV